MFHWMELFPNYVNSPTTTLLNLFYLDQEMSGNHRVDPQAIHIIRTAVLNKAADVKRTRSHQFRVEYFIFFLLKDN